MLTTIRIQDFRSIRDTSVKLGKVSLFIGPNNSGKSNFMKGIALMAKCIQMHPSLALNPDVFASLVPRNLYIQNIQVPIRFVIETKQYVDKAISLIIGYDYDIVNEGRVDFRQEIVVLNNAKEMHKFSGYVDQYYSDPDEDMYRPSDEVIGLKSEIFNLVVYRIEPSSFALSVGLSHQERLSSSGKNIVNFLYNLGQNHKSRYRQLEKDFSKCVGSLVSISTPADPSEPGKLKLKFFDEDDISYWAEEVSEGVLYFLALLCIVHQPSPPKLLLLEEPEKGIHPRRIKEVMNFIFDLARLRDIQIVLTSHSPYVVDHFADIPECISVFDRENGETVVHNAADIIEQTNQEYKEQGLPLTKYTDSLGEHWVSGFLGGVPR
ncbi:AAA family ATPase [Hymenobacter persicinus]|uniref:ATPase AAA-type core domain-containing protein n=1 Tax=Hymenobacter persicinus TaxID=2025506 RepID=A0A4Q5LGJ6_9BACT|nr:AAA family ATPase [Hymenobacter persicinus]RYU84430.1 hypothetical protein EWM57_01705 [Hymenobacter persicinus]